MKLIYIFLLLSQASNALNSQSYFKDTFADLKTSFFARVNALKTQFPNSLVLEQKIPVTSSEASSQDTSLKIDGFLLQTENTSKNSLIIIQSGVHGIEGYAGAGIQNFLLEYLPQQKGLSADVLFIHLVNPSGVQNFRRTNLNNVDLNRNFLDSESDFKKESPDYSKLNSFLNPEQAYSASMASSVHFYWQSLIQIWQHSINSLRQAILAGQNQYPKGLYYGGSKLEPEALALINLWNQVIPKYKNILLIDIHTGYGERGRLHLLAGHSEDPATQQIRRYFPKSKIEFGNQDKFYLTRGDISSYVHKNLTKNHNVASIAFEFGTMDSQKTLGSIKSLQRMVAENQSYHFGSKTPDDQVSIKKDFKAMFYPPEFEWRDGVVRQTKNEIDTLLSNLNEISK